MEIFPSEKQPVTSIDKVEELIVKRWLISIQLSLAEQAENVVLGKTLPNALWNVILIKRFGSDPNLNIPKHNISSSGTGKFPKDLLYFA